MRKILLLILTIGLSSQVNHANAQSALSNIDSVISSDSCFANERQTYDGFITYSVQQIKQAYGEKGKGFTSKTLKKKLSNERYEQLKTDYDCQLFSYLVDQTPVEAYYLASKENKSVTDTQLKPLAIFNRGGNGNFGRLSIFTMLGNRSIVDAGYVMLASQYRKKDEFGGNDLKDVLQLVTIGKQLPNTKSEDVHMIGVSRGGMMTYMAARELQTLKSITVWAGPTDLEGFLPHRPEMERVYQARIPHYKENKSAELTKRSVMKWSKELPPTLPILILHGDADKRVNVIHATSIAKQLVENNQPHKLIVYKGDNHGLRKNRRQAYAEIINWMDANNSQ